MSRRIREHCNLCGASWTQEWEEPPECPRCLNGEWCPDCDCWASECSCNSVEVTKELLHDCLEALSFLQQEWSWRRGLNTAAGLQLSRVDNLIKEVKEAMDDE